MDHERAGQRAVVAVLDSVGRAPQAQSALDRGTLSARGLDRSLRVAWSIADLAGAPAPSAQHVLQALTLRNGGAS